MCIGPEAGIGRLQADSSPLMIPNDFQLIETAHVWLQLHVSNDFILVTEWLLS